VQIQAKTSTDGVEFMDPAQDALIVVLKSIRDQADSVLKKIEQPVQQRSLSWKCAAPPDDRRFDIDCHVTPAFVMDRHRCD
jgi:hypothetical protein